MIERPTKYKTIQQFTRIKLTEGLATLAEILFESAQCGIGCVASKCSQCLECDHSDNAQWVGMYQFDK